MMMLAKNRRMIITLPQRLCNQNRAASTGTIFDRKESGEEMAYFKRKDSELIAEKKREQTFALSKRRKDELRNILGKFV